MAIKVKPCIKFIRVRRKWAKAYLRCKKYQREDGYIYCKDCCNEGRFNYCPTVPDAHMEFCENFCIVPDVYLR